MEHSGDGFLEEVTLSWLLKQRLAEGVREGVQVAVSWAWGVPLRASLLGRISLPLGLCPAGEPLAWGRGTGVACNGSWKL